ncbi:MAG: NADPH-dependent FMN reductase [Tateyamaria sp.]|uniref:NADPH-dependent FMN reductase n=1 Tax=Tateyamaria sp. TaxID=1929288 RepID=UPI00329F2DFF
MGTPTLLGISGSLRAESTNRKLLREAARLFGDCSYTEADLQMPLYDGDLEDAEGIPAPALALADQITSADAVILSTPEYNKGPSGALKNALDWVSRVEGNPWADKPVAVMSSAAGRAGGERAQMILRGYILPFHPRMLPGPEFHLAACYEAFDDDDKLTSDHYTKSLTTLMEKLHAEIKR